MKMAHKKLEFFWTSINKCLGPTTLRDYSLKETNVVLRGQVLVFFNRHNTKIEAERRILNMPGSRKIRQGFFFFSHLHRPYGPPGPIAS